MVTASPRTDFRLKRAKTLNSVPGSRFHDLSVSRVVIDAGVDLSIGISCHNKDSDDDFIRAVRLMEVAEDTLSHEIASVDADIDDLSSSRRIAIVGSGSND